MTYKEFTDFLDITIASFQRDEETYAKFQEEYKDMNPFAKFLAEIVEGLEEGKDPLGDYFQKNITRGQQFFTPMHITELMAELVDGSISDPCCGSGRMLLSSLKHARKKGIDPYGADLDPICVKMTAINLYGATGKIECKNTITGELSFYYELSPLKITRY